MAKQAQQTLPSKQPLTSPFPITDKPWQRRFPTPRNQDYFVSVRKDTRMGEFRMPQKGDPYTGADQENRLSDKFVFAIPVPVEQLPGFVDLYYVAPFEQQDTYNFTVEYPYADRDYPRITRTYYTLRTDLFATQELKAGTKDPVFGLPFVLTDHQVQRFEQDPVLDSVFVKVLRVFERLPSPVITSFESNQFQQIVKVETQEVATSVPPAQSATTEASKQERTGTAKAKNTLATVPDVFPQTTFITEIPSMTRELWLGGFFETTEEEVSAGTAVSPSIAAREYFITEKQETEFKKRVQTKSISPQTRSHTEITSQFGGGVLTEFLQTADPTTIIGVTGGYLTTEEKLRNLDTFGKIYMKKSLGDASTWPKLREIQVETNGIYAGIRIFVDKQYVENTFDPVSGTYKPPTPPVGAYVDIQAHDKWRSIQITSAVDLNSLPAPVTEPGIYPLDLPPSVRLVKGVFGTHADSNIRRLTDGSETDEFGGGVLGDYVVHYQENFHGHAIAEITRYFTPYRPTFSIANGGESVVIRLMDNTTITLNVLNIRPGGGTFVMLSQSGTNGSDIGPNIEFSARSSYRQEIHSVELKPCFTGALRQETMDMDFGINFAHSLITNLYDSVPLYCPSAGVPFVAAVDIQKWRFGIYVIQVVSPIPPFTPS